MAKVDSSLVAHLPLFAGFSAADLDSILSEARSMRFAKNTRRIPAGRGSALLLRAAARPCARQQDHAGRRADRGALRRDRRDLRGRQGDRPAALPGDRDRRRRQRRAGVAVRNMAAAGRKISGACRQHAADRRRPPSGNPYPRRRDVDRAGRKAHRSRPAAAGQAIRPQGRARRRNRFSDQPSGHRPDDRHHAAHGQPDAERLGRQRAWSKAAGRRSSSGNRTSCSCWPKKIRKQASSFKP